MKKQSKKKPFPLGKGKLFDISGKQITYWLEPLLSLSHDAFMVFEESGKILFANPTCTTFFDQKINKLMGADIQTIGPLGHKIAQDLQVVFDTDSALETVHNIRNQEEKHFEIHYTPPHVGMEQDTRSVLAIVRDISHTQNVIQELQAAKLHMDTQSKALQYFNLISESDLMGNITFANDDFCSLVGYDKAEIIGMNYRELNANHHDRIFFQDLWETIASGQVWNGIIKNKKADQTYFYVDTIITPILDSQNNISKFLTLQRDITESQEKFEEAQNFLFQFRDAFLHTPISMLSLDLSGHVIFCNNHFSNMTRFKQEEIQGMKWVDQFIHGESRLEIQNIFLKILSKKSGTHTFETHIISRTGQQKLSTWKASPTLDEDNNVTGISLIGEDITNRNFNEQELKILRKNLASGSKKTFGYLTHQLKSGFISLRCGLELMRDEIQDQPANELEQLIQKMDNKLQALENLNTKFLEGLKTDVRSTIITPETMDFGPILINLIKDIEQKTSKKLKITTTRLDRLNQVHWDPILMREVFDNLFSNAIKYSAENGVNIRVQCTRNKQDVLIQVKDDGLGIHEKDIHHIFDIFSRGSTRKEGFGLGLKFCQEVIQRHQGTIWVESEYGKGSSFFMRLPVDQSI
jgi:PAS domain S-box-containing protein